MELLSAAVFCLALNVYKEARGEPHVGQVAVAHVTLNRAKKRKQDVCSVVYARKQFSWTTTDTKNGALVRHPNYASAAWRKAVRIASVAHKLKDVTHGATMFHAASVNPYWASANKFAVQYGNHLFCKERTYKT